MLQLFFSNARFFEATLVPLSIVHCPSLWVDTPTETYTSALCGHSAVDACVVWWNDCIPETCGAKIENLLRKEAMKTEQTFSAVFPPSSEVGLQSFIQKPPTYVASLVTNHQSLIHHQNHVALQHNLKAAAANCKTAHPCPESLNCHWNHLKP